jgi:tetratricopeptide (TPR) repeat protein
VFAGKKSQGGITVRCGAELKRRCTGHSPFARVRAVFCLLFLFSFQTVFPHGGLHEQIHRVTQQIRQHPDRAALYLQRAELHRLHQDWQHAQADYDRAAELDPALDEVHLGRASLLLDTGRATEAVNLLNGLLERNPEHGEAWIARGRIYRRLKQPDRALADYEKALAVLQEPEPAHYVERARLMRGETARSIEAALQGLDEGIARLGPQLPLQLFAIELELARKDFDQALARLGTISSGDSRQEPWLALEGEILAQAGRTEQARQAFADALAAIESLPQHLRRADATRLIEQQVREHLARLPE